MSERTGVIYGIRYVPTGSIHYVGQTRQKPRARWQHHLNGRTDISKAIRTFARGLYDMVILETVPLDNLNEREGYWIEHLGTLWPGGLNHARGGNVQTRSDATRLRQSKAARRRYADPEQRRKASERQRQMAADPEIKANMIAAARARAQTPEYREASRVRMKARYEDPAFRAKIKEAAQARSKNPEYLEKIAAINRAKAQDPAFRERVRTSLQASPKRESVRAENTERLRQMAKDPEWRRLQSENRKREWADPEIRARRLAGLRRRKEVACLFD